MRHFKISTSVRTLKVENFRVLTYPPSGRERLKDSLEQRSGALKLLVQAEWDRFVSVKAATEGSLIRLAPFLEIFRSRNLNRRLYRDETRSPRSK